MQNAARMVVIEKVTGLGFSPEVAKSEMWIGQTYCKNGFSQEKEK